MKQYSTPSETSANQWAVSDEIVQEQRWGYILNNASNAYPGSKTLKSSAAVVAACLFAFSVGSVIPIALGETVGVDAKRLITLLCLAVLSLPLFGYALRSEKPVVYVNVKEAEICEVLPNLVGRPTVVNRMPFDDIGGVRIDHGGHGEHAVLSLYKGGMWCRIALLDASKKELGAIRERLARDVFRPQIMDTLSRSANIDAATGFDPSDPGRIIKIA